MPLDKNGPPPDGDEVMAQRLIAQAQWDAFVAAGRALVMCRSKSRLRLCVIALDACSIVHGGGAHWSGHAHVYTLRKFAADIEMSYKTLHGWVRAKARVYDSLSPAERQELSWTAGERCLRGSSSDATRDEICAGYRREREAMKRGQSRIPG